MSLTGFPPGAAQRLATVQRAALSFVDSTRRAAQAHETEVGRVAALLATGDPVSAEHLRAGARVAAEESVRRAEEQADAVAKAANKRILTLAGRFGATLAEEARYHNQLRAERGRELVAGVARVDATAARAMEEAIAAGDRARVDNATLQGQLIADAAAGALGGRVARA